MLIMLNTYCKLIIYSPITGWLSPHCTRPTVPILIFHSCLHIGVGPYFLFVLAHQTPPPREIADVQSQLWPYQDSSLQLPIHISLFFAEKCLTFSVFSSFHVATRLLYSDRHPEVNNQIFHKPVWNMRIHFWFCPGSSACDIILTPEHFYLSIKSHSCNSCQWKGIAIQKPVTLRPRWWR